MTKRQSPAQLHANQHNATLGGIAMSIRCVQRARKCRSLTEATRGRLLLIEGLLWESYRDARRYRVEPDGSIKELSEN
jgi:hypothetical protein